MRFECGMRGLVIVCRESGGCIWKVVSGNMQKGGNADYLSLCHAHGRGSDGMNENAVCWQKVKMPDMHFITSCVPLTGSNSREASYAGRPKRFI